MQHSLHKQKGVNLVELMVGIAIGLMVVTAAVSTLVINKTSSTTVSDTSVLTNQANAALRAISFYAKQGGALTAQRMPTPKTYRIEDPPNDPLAALPPVPTAAVRGTNNDQPNASDSLTLWVSHMDATMTRDCLGNTVATTGAMMRNRFFLADNAGGVRRLMCLGAIDAVAAQPIADNVEDFQVRYYETTAAGTSVWRHANDVTDWSAVSALDVCLQIRGEMMHGTNAFTGLPNYTNCKDASVAHDGYLRVVARQVIQMRNRATNLLIPV